MYSTVGVEMTSIPWFLWYEHCKCFLAAILELHDDVIHSYTCNVIQVIGCNRYSTGRRLNEVDRNVGSWDIDIKDELLAFILGNGILDANMMQCSGSLDRNLVLRLSIWYITLAFVKTGNNHPAIPFHDSLTLTKNCDYDELNQIYHAVFHKKHQIWQTSRPIYYEGTWIMAHRGFDPWRPRQPFSKMAAEGTYRI